MGTCLFVEIKIGYKMKFAALVFLGVCVGVAVSEMCRSDADCDHETCVGDGWSVNCHFGTCTCDHTDHTGSKCISQSDCNDNCPGGNNQHCVDNMCRCLRN